MSKAGKKKAKSEARRANSKFASHNISMIDHHQRLGSKLIPPLAQIPKMTTSSWVDHHMPEMLWAVVLAGTMERRHYLNCFRKIAVVCREWFLKKEKSQESEVEADPDAGLNFKVIADHTKLAEVSDEEFKKFLVIPLSHPLGYAALRPLLLLECLPGHERWRRELAVEPTDDDWNTLARSVAGVLDHQSEASTDIRWFKVILPIISGRMLFPESAAESLEELRLFPDKGDMRQVRPFIRSTEMTMRRNPHSAWVDEFWSLAMRSTGCVDPSEDRVTRSLTPRLTPTRSMPHATKLWTGFAGASRQSVSIRGWIRRSVLRCMR